MTKNWVHGVGHSPVCQILLQIVVRAVITSFPSAWTSSAGMLSTPADFPFFNDCTVASTSLRRMGWSSSVSVGVQFSTDGSLLALCLYSSEQYSVHRFSICRSTTTRGREFWLHKLFEDARLPYRRRSPYLLPSWRRTLLPAVSQLAATKNTQHAQ